MAYLGVHSKNHNDRLPAEL